MPHRILKTCFSGIELPLSLSFSRTDHRLPFCSHKHTNISESDHVHLGYVGHTSGCTSLLWYKAEVTRLQFFLHDQQRCVQPDSRRWGDYKSDASPLLSEPPGGLPGHGTGSSSRRRSAHPLPLPPDQHNWIPWEEDTESFDSRLLFCFVLKGEIISQRAEDYIYQRCATKRNTWGMCVHLER